MTNQIWLSIQPACATQGERPQLSSENREKILQAAFAVLSRQGYENTSIKVIAEEAGVAQGLVHYYFKSKQQLVIAVLFEVCRRWTSTRGREPRARWRPLRTSRFFSGPGPMRTPFISS